MQTLKTNSQITGKPTRLGIISALAEEQEGLIQAMQHAERHVHGMREYTVGNLWKVDTVAVLSRIGKVAAAMTATTLVERFGVTHILFTGVAGSADANVRVGDVVIAESLVQHDMDASPLFPRFDVPLTGLSHLPSDLGLSSRLAGAASTFLDSENGATLHRGLIGSGDQFINDGMRLAALKSALPGLLAVEMEGAAVAQVCFELGIPFAVIRTISDNANEDAATDFMAFVKTVASRYAFGIIEKFCRNHAA
ncbi:5'-methylthioadenosine/adenosylhomocysteine nucleosidase [Pseudoduganella umbonata]|uniref:adenosylhomocysteine nucleosidase n=1 Tax=Pseudoduganella umbonata TaxID=864828 RepID=A0A4P8HS10_9BURK|nr:5'-methylthioadenosine/adenosylhomocysteine nucleosidase [Pseudoduganella umbonata]MBB3222411.1 adenosylhomocysteine nucleosidase [Pseudoduganella umbonata]QCP12623.1 5'-methylthioadenosine/adenosylhomocysteine nucleosidase [Pseudoduganella umbonata]